MNNRKYKNSQVITSKNLSRSSLTHKLIRYSSFRQNSQENTQPEPRRFSSFRIQPKIIYDETWLSNKQYNARVAAQPEKSRKKTLETVSKRKSPRTNTYQESNGQIIHERIYASAVKSKLCLRVAVNGASKSMRGQLPLANLNLINGDFGDDAGMIVDNRDYSFVGQLR